MSESIAQWLARLGLSQYTGPFEEHAIGLEHLAELNHDVLKDIGVHAVGHRLTILKAAAASRQAAEAAPLPGPDPPGDAEHRQLSVMFCDLVDSTGLAERLDLEAYRELISDYQRAARLAMERYGGFIARYMGDGLLVYFGYPRAHENDAERAVRAGLDVVDLVAAIITPGEEVLRVRVGIATGRVVAGDIIGEGASEEHAVLGETPNLAARLQSLAPPNGVIVAEATQRLVEGRFELEPLQPQRVKGLRDPVRSFQAKAIRAASRFEAATARGLSHFLGRGSELQLLLDRWSQARDGEGQVVLLSGEAGIGKSRMLRELREQISDEPHTSLRYQCSPFSTKTAFAPIIDQLVNGAGIIPDDSTARKLDKIESLLSTSVGDTATAPLFANLLSIPGDRYPPLSMTAQRQKLGIIAGLVAQLEALAGQRPVLVLVEDAHWMDASTLETFDAIVERTRALPVLVVMTHRPELESTWGRFGHVTVHSLNRLNRRDARALSEHVTGGRALPEVVIDEILKRTDGVPLFVEELTKAVMETGLLTEVDGRYVLDRPLSHLAIPTTIQDSLMERLDRLAPVKEVAQAAACIGREFTVPLLAQILERASLEDDLKQLLDAGLIFRRGTGESEIYSFKHALVQDAAYESLLASKRRRFHAHIAPALEASPDPDPAVLARHFSAAHVADKAANYFLAAGERALAMSALTEAASESELGLAEIEHLPASAARDRIELDLRMALGAARLASFGWPHASVRAAYEPAFDLAGKLEDRRSLGRILWGLCVHHWTRAEFAETHQWLARLETVADRSNDDELTVVRDMSAGCQYFWEAEYERAFRYTTHVRDAYDEKRHAVIAAYTNHDPLCFSLHWAGSLLQWIIGYPDLALELADEAHSLARRIGHPFNSAFALTAGSECLLMRGDCQRVLRCCEEVQQIIEEEALGDFAQHVLVDNWRGRTHTRMGEYETGYRLTKLATTRWQQAEGRICSALFWSGEATALGGLGRTRDALALVDTSIEHCRRTGDRFMEPEVLRVKAELLLAADGSNSDAAESILRESLRVARDHKAKSWELRTATSLAGLMDARGQRASAVQLLAPVHAWFSEGFDTTDLRAATALLETLS